jgi:quercetin dioxygenase-like cupin family protein
MNRAHHRIREYAPYHNTPPTPVLAPGIEQKASRMSRVNSIAATTVRIRIRPRGQAVQRELSGAHTLIVTQGRGQLQWASGDAQSLSSGDVSSLAAGRYRVANASLSDPLEVLLIAP